MANWGQFLMSDSSSVSMFLIDSVHDWIMFALLVVVSVVFSWMGGLFLSGYMVNRMLLSHEILEIIWSVTPIGMLGMLMGPSLSSLYCSDDPSQPSFTLKVMGNQWFWTYEYPDVPVESNSSYMSQPEALWDYRNIDVDNGVVLPSSVPIRAVISSEDVIHSWALPALGVKMDAIPGRLNEISMFSAKCGTVFGQCSEICGALHSFMPVKLEMASVEYFRKLVLLLSTMSAPDFGSGGGIFQ